MLFTKITKKERKKERNFITFTFFGVLNAKQFATQYKAFWKVRMLYQKYQENQNGCGIIKHVSLIRYFWIPLFISSIIHIPFYIFHHPYYWKFDAVMILYVTYIITVPFVWIMLSIKTDTHSNAKCFIFDFLHKRS